MDEISNKTLAVLVAVAIIISLAGTMMVMSRVRTGTTGAATGIARVNITAVVAISLPTNVVDFGTVFQGATDNTSDDNPAPLTVQNDGGVLVNVSIARDTGSTALFSGTGGGDNTASFRFKVDNSSEVNSFDYSASTTSWTNVPGTTPTANIIAYLEYSDSNDLAEVDLLISVPSDESTGTKNETLVFIGSQS